MSRPPLLVRVAGSPLPAFLLFVGYALVVAGWYDGEVAWWLALGSVGAAMRTVAAIGRVRRYKAWLAEWNAMGETEQPRAKKRRGGRRFVCITGVVLLLLTIPACLRHLQGNQALTLLWVVVGICLLGLVLRRINRRIAKRRNAGPEAVSIPVVEWMLGRASSSPTRAEAARKLPEYCTRLLGS